MQIFDEVPSQLVTMHQQMFSNRFDSIRNCLIELNSSGAIHFTIHFNPFIVVIAVG